MRIGVKRPGVAYEIPKRKSGYVAKSQSLRCTLQRWYQVPPLLPLLWSSLSPLRDRSDLLFQREPPSLARMATTPQMIAPEEGKLLSESLSTVKIQTQQMKRHLASRVHFPFLLNL